MADDDTHRRAAPDLVAGPRPTVASGAVTVLSGQLAIYVLAFATSIVVARALGPAGRGEYYLPVTAAAVCLTIVNLGVESANVVALAERRCSLADLSRNAAFLALVLGPLAMAGMLGAFFIARSAVFEGVKFGDYAIAVATIPFSLHVLWVTSLFLLAKRLGRAQVALSAGAALQLAGAVVLAALGVLGVTEVLLLYAVAVLAPWLILAMWSSDVAPLRPAVNPRVFREVVPFGLKLHGGLVLQYLLLRFDVFLVSAYLGQADVGLYSLAVLFAELAWLITNPLVQAILPFQVETSSRESAPLAFKAARFNFAIAGVLCGLFAISLWPGLPLIYGADFASAYPALVTLLPGVWLMAGARPLTTLITRQDRPLLYSGLSLAAFSVNVALNVLLIPAIGIIGASLASSIAYALMACALIAWALRAGDLRPGQALKPQVGDVETVSRTVRELATRRLRRAANTG